jgi:uncharacterized protein (TIGR01777 family)
VTDASHASRVKVVVAGGTGTLGRRLSADFAQRGHDVVVLTRAPRSGVAHRQIQWDGRTVGPWADELAGAVVCNLAGELVDRRPTATNIALLERSRVEPTMTLARAARDVAAPPRLWLQMSTLAIYGDAGDVVLDEGAPPADGPPQMAGVALAWEAAAREARADRVVVLRTGIVLEHGSPAFDRLSTLARFGLGGRIASGEQWVSWLHVDDNLRALRFVGEHVEIDGVVHVTAPEPVRNREMMAALRHAFRRPWSPPTPAPLVKLGARLMRTDPALALTGRRCIPRRLLDAGFTFEFPRFEAALADLAGRR